VSEDDVLFGYRLRVLDYAGRTSVSEACRVFGIHRSTFYVWKRRAERHGLEILRPRERAGRGCRSSCRRLSRSGSSRSLLATEGLGHGASRTSWAGSAGAGSSSRTTASGAACAGTGSTRG
jgi:hypothetical protein